MAEILTVTTPLVNKNNPIHANRPVGNSEIPFDLQDIATVPKSAGAQEQILEQNTGLLEGKGADNILTNLLKDPAAAVGFLKNIYVLQEIVKLLPAHNSTLTQGIEQMFGSLMISPEDIATEMAFQENTSTVFRGELFNFLRGLLSQNTSTDMQLAVASLLKSINSLAGRQEALRAVANSLQYLSETLTPSKDVSRRLGELSQAFRQENAEEYFSQLKSRVVALLKEIEGNLLFTSRLEKISSITLYNLSRYNDNTEFFHESVSHLMTLLDACGRAELTGLLENFPSQLQQMIKEREMSKIMDVLTRLIDSQAQQETLSASNAEKLEKIITSLLSSPCHFTPLLHFVVPVDNGSMRSFAEIWINPNGQEDRRDGVETKECTHMLLVFDIEGIGQFEAELYAVDKAITLSLLCPAPYSERFAQVVQAFTACVAGTGYRMEEVSVGTLVKPRSLMEVFKSLPYKRTGVDVKV